MLKQMYAYKCTKCGELHHPRHFVCKKCNSREFEEVPLEGTCKLLTWTRVYNLPEGYMKPYIVFGIVQFENGLRVAGQLDVENPEIGIELASSVAIVKEGVGRDNYGFIFQDM